MKFRYVGVTAFQVMSIDLAYARDEIAGRDIYD